jgi:hypothetical protein
MYRAGDRVTHAYFVTAGIVPGWVGWKAGGGIAVTGNEGVIGIASFLGAKPRRVTPWCCAPATAIGSRRTC